MRQVWKMALSRNSVTEFQLPRGAEFLGGALQSGPEGTPQVILFALLDPAAPEEARRVMACVSGEPIADELDDRLTHIVTVQAIPPSGVPMVVHVFEVGPVLQ